jgi:peptidyl-prolyl cis-trans isomerase C
MSRTEGGCGGGGCQCAGQAPATAAPLVPVASINGIALHAPGEALPAEELCERAWAELLRQEAVRQQLLPRQAVLTMPVLDASQQDVIQAMVDREVPLTRPTEQEARRYHDGHRNRFVEGARAQVRHILFAVTDGVNVEALAARAEQALLELSHKDVAPGRFAELARELSNCPSGADGGDLGWLAPQEIAPELADELFHQPASAQLFGLRQRLVHSRYGFHIIDVVAREPGRERPFEDVQDTISMVLAQQARARALHQYIRVLAGRALVEGVELDAADTPLVQ